MECCKRLTEMHPDPRSRSCVARQDCRLPAQKLQTVTGLRSGVTPHEWRCQAPPPDVLQSAVVFEGWVLGHAREAGVASRGASGSGTFALLRGGLWWSGLPGSLVRGVSPLWALLILNLESSDDGPTLTSTCGDTSGGPILPSLVACMPRAYRPGAEPPPQPRPDFKSGGRRDCILCSVSRCQERSFAGPHLSALHKPSGRRSSRS